MNGKVIEAGWSPKGEYVRFDEGTEIARQLLLNLVDGTVKDLPEAERGALKDSRRTVIEELNDPFKINGLWRVIQAFRASLPDGVIDNGAGVLGVYFSVIEKKAEEVK